MDLAPIVPWLGAIALILSIGNTVMAIVTRGSKDNADKIAAQEKKLIDHDRRIQAVENEVKHLPDKDTVMDVKLALAELKGTVGALTETVGSIGRTVHRIEDYLQEKS